MSVVINSNISAQIAANNLAHSQQMLSDSLNKLSSGSKIVNPSDDAGGLAVSMKLTATANRERHGIGLPTQPRAKHPIHAQTGRVIKDSPGISWTETHRGSLSEPGATV